MLDREVGTFLLKIGLYGTIVELTERIMIFRLNNILLDQETQLQYATFQSLHSRLLFQ